jgi:genome maintenance exonuclease 1
MLKIREPVLLDREDGHWYQTKFDKIYPSISTILSATAPEHKKNGLKTWKENEPAHEYITKQAQDIGTQSHKIIEDYLSNSLAMDEFDLLPIFLMLHPLNKECILTNYRLQELVT